jgi:hypothetical protein
VVLGVLDWRRFLGPSRRGYEKHSQRHSSAVVAQLVEHELPKLGVEGSNPFRRSREVNGVGSSADFFLIDSGTGSGTFRHRASDFRRLCGLSSLLRRSIYNRPKRKRADENRKVCESVHGGCTRDASRRRSPVNVAQIARA